MKKLTTKEIVYVGMFAAVLAVISQISIPMPTGVPITIQVFGAALVGAVLGWRLGLMATIVYILIGAIGAPVFANFRGGFDVLTGVTGGYLWTFPILTALSGIRPKASKKTVNLLLQIVLALVGLAVVEVVGGIQWAVIGGSQTFGAIMAYALIAFIPKDSIITVLAVIIGRSIRRRLLKSL